MTDPDRIILSAVGDISFQGRLADAPDPAVFAGVAELFRPNDLVVGNLENPLCSGLAPVAGKCTLRGAPGWADVLKASRFDLLSLANNHLMDFGPQGLLDTLAALDRVGMAHVGAGRNAAEACQAYTATVKGRRLAFIARSAVWVSSHCFATTDLPGVAAFDERETLEQIRRLKQSHDRVVLILHWGIEEYQYPSPEQRRQATRLLQAGADLVLGHHPHVLQGFESGPGGTVAYSLGNFLFDRFTWRFDAPGQEPRELLSELTEPNRRGMILRVDLGGAPGRPALAVPTYIAQHCAVIVDDRPRRRSELARLSRRLRWPFYRYGWRLYALRMEWRLRLGRRLSPAHVVRNLHKLRLRHVFDLIAQLKRSTRLASGKSTNPYE